MNIASIAERQAGAEELAGWLCCGELENLSTTQS